MSGTFQIMKMEVKLGKTVKIKGKGANDAERFAVNLGKGPEKLGLHLNPRFSQNTIVCNSFDCGWGTEQLENHLCFCPGSEIKLTVSFECVGFKVTLPDGHQFTFPNRLGHSHLSYLRVEGGFSISSLKFA